MIFSDLILIPQIVWSEYHVNPNSSGDLTADEIQSSFEQYNNFPMGATRHRDRLFITLPRRRPGMPATISYVRMTSPKGSSPSLQAYPTFRTNQLHVSVSNLFPAVIPRAKIAKYA